MLSGYEIIAQISSVAGFFHVSLCRLGLATTVKSHGGCAFGSTSNDGVEFWRDTDDTLAGNTKGLGCYGGGHLTAGPALT